MKEFKSTVSQKKLVKEFVAPVSCRLLDDGVLFVDFGRAAFGTVIVAMPVSHRRSKLVVHLGEKLGPDGRIDRVPPGTIRYRRVEQALTGSEPECRLVIPHDKRNTGKNAITMPEYIGEVIPFRYIEIEDGSGIDPWAVRQTAVHYPFDDNASAFKSSSDVLNAVWDLCKYTIKATTFCGIYIDGDRERIPYEGDAYINQLGHYGVDSEYDFARFSTEYMIQHPTWCTEWHMHSVMMAWQDYMYSGQTSTLAVFYDELCAKTLLDFARSDGLISVANELRSPEMQERLNKHLASGVIREDIRDLVDWPPGSFTAGGTGERDNHEMLAVNTVPNAFHCHTLYLMSCIAGVLGRKADEQRFISRAEKVKSTMNRLLFDEKKGIYIDGEDSGHSSLHSNMFMLAFGLVPEYRIKKVLDFVKSRGMACSVYGAQHLLDALYLNGEDRTALELMTARHDRSWWNMIQSGSTMTLEAWDLKYKNNLDWNHAWGAAPANIIPRRLLGVRPLQSGFKQAIVKPQVGSLDNVSGRVPTPLGGIEVTVSNSDEVFELTVDLPEEMTARLGIPQRDSGSTKLEMDGDDVYAELAGAYLYLDDVGSGAHTIVSRTH